MSLDFILIPLCIITILWLLNRENMVYKKKKESLIINNKRLFFNSEIVRF